MINIEQSIKNIIENKNIFEYDKPKLIKLLEKSSKITFGKNGRSECYLYNNMKLPRCTSILKMDGSRADGLIIWAKREVSQYAYDNLLKAYNENNLNLNTISLICQEAVKNPDAQRDKAANVGSDKHDKIEKWLNSYDKSFDEDIKDFINIWNNEHVELIATELPIAFCVHEVGFGGKLDILAYKDGELIIYDNKTSKSLHQSYGLQVSAYACAVNQMLEVLLGDKLKVSRGKIIHIPDTNTMSELQIKEFNKRGNLVECKNMCEGFNHFLTLACLYNKRNNKYL